jgi:histidine triad (HIT) family protein
MPARSVCPFCGIAEGTQPANLVLRTEDIVAFLDVRPVFLGHVLLIPRVHYATLQDVPDALVGRMFLEARSMSRAVETGLGANGTFLGLNNKVSQSVAHVHLHVIPRRKGDGLRGFFWPRQKYANEEEAAAAAAIAGRIRDAL